MQFINTKDDKNPFVVQLKKNTAALDKELDLIKEKQKQLNILERQMKKTDDEDSKDEESSEATE